ncbi:MAG: hypothetical protein AABW41_02310 [Nanoarchaeota archaeon]
MLHPEYVKSLKADLSLNGDGELEVKKGDKHEVVISVDYDRFKQFLYDGLRLKQAK